MADERISCTYRRQKQEGKQSRAASFIRAAALVFIEEIHLGKWAPASGLYRLVALKNA